MSTERARPAWDAGLLWAPVVGVAAATQLGVGLEEPWAGSDLGLTVTSLLLAVPLLLRRRKPMLAAGAVALALPVQQALGGSLSFGSFVAALVSVFAAGRYAGPRVALGAPLVMLAGVVVAARDSLPGATDELVFPLFYVSASAGLGAVVRRLSTQAETLEELNAALAAERDASAQLATAAERLRLARELHDSVAHTLTVTVVQAERCEQALPHDPEAARTAAAAIQQVGRDGLAQLRTTVRVLRDPGARREAPDLTDLPALAAVIRDSGIEVDLRVDGDPSTVPETVSQEVLRMAQEALTNVVKHSGATTAVVRVTCSDSAVELEVTDPGPALQTSVPSGAFGLAGMRERLRPMRAELESGPDGGGFRVRVSIPLLGDES